MLLAVRIASCQILSLMTLDDFWNIVERVHAASPHDMEAKCRRLAEELRPLSTQEVISFGTHFTDCFYQAYTCDIWGAAFVMNDGCGDDSFMDFRSTLISLGRAPFLSALRSADDLADFDMASEWSTYEGYQYVTSTVIAEKEGEEYAVTRSSKPHPQEPVGVPFIEWEASKRYPKLAAKFGFKDSSWLYLKTQQEKQAKDRESGIQLANLMLESGVIPSCGLIPPPRIVAAALRTGKPSPSTSRLNQWEPFELDENHYWTAVSYLQDPAAELPQSRPDLQGVKLMLDLGASAATDFETWIQTLKERGLEKH